MERIIIIGGGGLAIEIFEYLHSDNVKVAGYVAPEKGSFLSQHIEWLGDDDEGFDPAAKYVLGTGLVSLRHKIISFYEERGAFFFNYIHPTSYVSKLATIGKGVFIAPNVSILGNAEIGDYFFANVNSSVGHDAEVGKNVVLSPGVRVNGFCHIGSNTTLGSNSALVPNTSIGEWAEVCICTYPKRIVQSGYTSFSMPGKNIKL